MTTASSPWTTPNGKFVNGEAAIIINGTGNASTYTEKGINWQCSLGLEGSGGVATNFSVDSLAVASYCENKALAADPHQVHHQRRV